MDILSTVQDPNGNEQTMSSVEIAQITGKTHGNVLKDIDKLNANYLKMNMSKISLMERPHPTIANRLIRTMHLTKMQTLDLLTGYNIELRIKVNRRWEELELASNNTPKIPQTFSEALMLAAEQAEQLELQAPKVKFANNILESESSISISNMAKLIGLGQNKLFSKLRDDKILMKGGNRHNVPYQRYIDSGYFEVTERPWKNEKGDGITFVSKVTPKGQQYISNKYKTKTI